MFIEVVACVIGVAIIRLINNPYYFDSLYFFFIPVQAHKWTEWTESPTPIIGNKIRFDSILGTKLNLFLGTNRWIESLARRKITRMNRIELCLLLLGLFDSFVIPILQCNVCRSCMGSCYLILCQPILVNWKDKVLPIPSTWLAFQWIVLDSFLL